MEYKGWKIEENSYGFTKRLHSDGYKAFDMNDCDASMIYGSDIAEVKEQIDKVLS
jgi:hypothetical protein